ncbi:SDR family NAD(P)-dependent oxidoreductase [Novosphingobium sp.]|uniref:SDR family NAD(P)-dependent oxidoreductase n=1 Tax=Novosphingobium sp. TaxID=1874826 RepID=UPI003BAD2962
MNKAVVITGVSSGIGEACAKLFVEQGFLVFGSVRNVEDGARLKGLLGERFTALTFDIVDAEAVGRAADFVQLKLGGETLFGLVNNAGMTSVGPLMHLPPDELLRTLHINTVGALIVTQAFLPMLGAMAAPTKRPGRIINISSVGGRIVAPFAASYQASKHAIEALSDGLRRELLIYGIEVVVIEPGSTVTAIWDKSDGSLERYRATDFGPAFERFLDLFGRLGRKGYPPRRIAEVVHRALTVRRPRTRYPVVPGAFLNWIVPRALPDRWLDIGMARAIGLKRINKD